MKNINVIKEKCIGCGACVAIDPIHFEFDEKGKSNVISNENLESENLTNAIESCPTVAIELIEGEEKESVKATDEVCTGCNDDSCTCIDCDCNECKNHQDTEI